MGFVHVPLLQAYGHDSTCRDDLLAGLQTPTQVVSDSAFLDLARQQELQEDHHIRLLTPLKGNMQPTDQRNFYRPSIGASTPAAHRDRLCPIGPTLPRPNHENARCLASTKSMDDQDPRPFHRSLAQYSTETKNPGL